MGQASPYVGWTRGTTVYDNFLSPMLVPMLYKNIPQK
jgi:hypothetical protein